MKKKMSEAEDGNRNIPLTTNLTSLMISKLFGLSIKAGNIKMKKHNYLMQVCRFSAFFCRSLTLHQSSM